ncbi:SEA domain-containing protein [Ditylenchus destructor]|nr:SEA domain-containing protein [Ditylenchus destructor]
MGLCMLCLSVLSLLINQIVPHSASGTSVYRITFNLPDVPFSAGLRHQHSKEFKSVSEEVITAINSRLSEDYVSFRSASVHGFRYQAVIGTLVVIDLIFAKSSSTIAEQIQNTLEEYAKEGHIGMLDIAPEGFEFVVVEGGGKPTVSCPDGSVPEFSLHGSTYCWSHSVCPSGTACIEGQCCKSARKYYT